MSDQTQNEDAGVQQDQTQETPTQEVQPQVEKPTTTTPQTLSDEQVASLKDSITKDVSGKVSTSVIQRIGEALGLTKKQEEALPTDAAQLQKIVDQKLEERFTKLQQQADQEEKQTETQRQERINGIVQGWYSQYDQMARLGKVPQMKQAVEGDPGYDARKKIILAIGEMINENKQKGVDYTPSISDVLIANPQVLEGVPGANLPISGNTQVRESAADFKHSDITSKSWEEIASGNI